MSLYINTTYIPNINSNILFPSEFFVQIIFPESITARSMKTIHFFPLKLRIS
jgi:hypothetical protein